MRAAPERGCVRWHVRHRRGRKGREEREETEGSTAREEPLARGPGARGPRPKRAEDSHATDATLCTAGSLTRNDWCW